MDWDEMVLVGRIARPHGLRGEVVVNPETDFLEERFRRGWPRTAGDLPVRSAPGWVVSPVGLGFEQPATYFHNDEGDFRNILASSWAPSLLRLHRYTGRDIDHGQKVAATGELQNAGEVLSDAVQERLSRALRTDVALGAGWGAVLGRAGAAAAKLALGIVMGVIAAFAALRG